MPRRKGRIDMSIDEKKLNPPEPKQVRIARKLFSHRYRGGEIERREHEERDVATRKSRAR